MQSSKDISSSCINYLSLEGSNHVIKGTFTCDGNLTDPGGPGTQPAGSNAETLSNGTTPTSVSTSTPTASSSTGSSASATAVKPSSSSLSTGAKAGIGVGVALGVLLAAALVGVVLFRRRKAHLKPEVNEEVAEEKKDPTNLTEELPDSQRHELAQQHGASELGRSTSGRLLGKEERHELEGKHGASEMATEQRHELEGNSVDLRRDDAEK